MLRHYVQRLGHLSWVDLLPAAEFAINNSVHESTGSTPFRLAYGRNPQVPISVRPSKVPSAAEWIATLEKGLAEARRCMQAAQQRQKIYYDEGRRPLRFAVGDKVLLSTKNLRLRSVGDKAVSPKLLPRFVGPFTVAREIREGAAYKLDLPATMRVHPVFHVSRLKPFRESTIPGRVQPPPPPVVSDGEPWFEVQAILKHEDARGSRRCLVAWKGYDDTHNSWEPHDNLIHTMAYKSYCRRAGIPPRPSAAQKRKRGK
jgi:hypothetical protein